MTKKNQYANAEGASFALPAAARRYDRRKRAADFCFAFLFLLAAAIPMLLLACLIRIDSKGAPLFRQERVGRCGKSFICYKFRTMQTAAPHSCATGKLQGAEDLITPLGRILRKTSVDELPQLINILKGDMSFVGPRPLIPEEKEVHEARLKAGVYALRPGLTGNAQINGRDLISAEEKVRLDTEYLRAYSLREDLRILKKTVGNVLFGKDIHEGTL